MYSYRPPHMAEQKQDDHLENTYSIYVRIRDVALKTCLRRWTKEKSGERGSGISVLAARHDDDDNIPQSPHLIQGLAVIISPKIDQECSILSYDYLNWHTQDCLFVRGKICLGGKLHWKDSLKLQNPWQIKTPVSNFHNNIFVLGVMSFKMISFHQTKMLLSLVNEVVLRHINLLRLIKRRIRFLTIQLSLSLVFDYKQLNIKSVLFQKIKFSISRLLSFIKTITNATNQGQSKSGSGDNEGVLRIPQSSSITGTSPSECLVS